jgi:hypothetical protein
MEADPHSPQAQSASPAGLDQAEVVVIGGGIIGCSIAYHLCRAGITDVLVLDRNPLASGATARSAGCLSHLRPNASTTAMISRTREGDPRARGTARRIARLSPGRLHPRGVERDRAKRSCCRSKRAPQRGPGRRDDQCRRRARPVSMARLAAARRIVFVAADGLHRRRAARHRVRPRGARNGRADPARDRGSRTSRTKTERSIGVDTDAGHVAQPLGRRCGRRMECRSRVLGRLGIRGALRRAAITGSPRPTAAARPDVRTSSSPTCAPICARRSAGCWSACRSPCRARSTR